MRPAACKRALVRAAVLAGLLLAAGGLQGGPAHAQTVKLSPFWNKDAVSGTLGRPQGAGPHPAVVLMHGCGGILPSVERAWAQRLRSWGYATLLVDSFRPRGKPQNLCSEPDPRKTVSLLDRAYDAYAGLAYLQSLPDVDKTRVALMGWSQGGMTALQAFARVAFDRVAETLHGGFRAAIAVYPECGLQYGEWHVTRTKFSTGPITSYEGKYDALAPLLILAGELDDWTPAGPCRELAKTSDLVDIIVYPGARHAFDGEWAYHYGKTFRNRYKPGGCCGGSIGRNEAALKRSIADARGYLRKHIGGN